tara:strand:- start:136 stop:558 length:423 start_codon:yes stop_codon:yes gene_type:complete
MRTTIDYLNEIERAKGMLDDAQDWNPRAWDWHDAIHGYIVELEDDLLAFAEEPVEPPAPLVTPTEESAEFEAMFDPIAGFLPLTVPEAKRLAEAKYEEWGQWVLECMTDMDIQVDIHGLTQDEWISVREDIHSILTDRGC